MKKAKRPLGIFNKVFPGSSAEQAHAIRRAGFDCIQLDVPARCADAREFVKPFAGEGIFVAAMSGYTNLVHPDPALKAEGLARLKRLIELAPRCGTRYVATETGSKNPKGQFAWHRDNATPAAWTELVAVVGDLLDHAKAHDVVLLLEPYVNNVCRTVDDAVRLRRQVASPHLQFVLDTHNMFLESHLADGDAYLRRIFAELTEATPIAHAKDLLYTNGAVSTPKAGSGVLNWSLHAQLLNRHLPDTPLILEHLTVEDVPAVREFVLQKLAENP